jgi:Undecaprenyl-phosphate glucose phosphotransferase
MPALEEERRSGTAPRTFPISSNVLPGLVVAMDSAAILLTAIIFHDIFVGDFFDASEIYIAATVFIWLSSLMLMNFGGLYKFDAILRPLAFIDEFLLAFATAFLFLLAAAFSIKITETFSRLWIGSFVFGACAATLGVHLCTAIVMRQMGNALLFTRHVVVAGEGNQVRVLLAHLEKFPSRFVTVLGLFADRSSDHKTEFGRFSVLGQLDEVQNFVRANAVDDVILALPWSSDQQISTLLDRLRDLPVNVYLSADLVGFRLAFRQPPDHFGDVPLVEIMGRPLAGWGEVRKAVLDYGLGSVLTLLLLPVMALIAIAIKLDSRGPVLFSQERYGFVNRVFIINKFRSMRHEQTPAPAKTVQATRTDPRVTRVGRFLRRTSLDELPQLFNVLNGTMSLVGPRPHTIDHNQEYSRMIRGYFARHRVKPGITGWAQVNGLRGETKALDAMEARIRFDIYYVENWSLLFDLQILARTPLVLLSRRNAY